MANLSPKTFFHELRRREVFKTVALYIVGAWVALQVADLAFPGMDIPDSAIRYVWLAAILLFPLVLIFAWRYDLSASGIRRTLPTDAVDEDRALRGSDYGTIGGLSVIALGVLAVMAVQISRVEHEREFAAPANSIAVMPFEVCEGAPVDLMLARGLADEVINRLAERGKLKVIARASAQAFAGFGLSVPEIAKPLGVEYVLKGEVCRDGTTPTLTAELSDQQGFIVWSGSFTQQVNEFEQITRRLASQVADGVAAELGDVLALEPDPPVNTQAYEQYLMGLGYIWKDDPNKAREALFKALEIDPDYARAMLLMAELDYMDWIGLEAGTAMEETRPLVEKALAVARRELEQFPNSANAHFAAASALSSLAYWDRNLLWRKPGDVDEAKLAAQKQAVHAMYAEAEHHFRTAISLNPSRSEFYVELAFALEGQGHERDAEALEVLERGLARDPHSMRLNWRIAQRWVQRGRFRQAIELLERLKQLPDIPAGAWFWQLEFMWANTYWDERFEVLIDMLTNDPEAFKECWGCRWQATWVPVHILASLDLDELAEEWKARIENVELHDWMRRFGRINYLYASGQNERLTKELVGQVTKMSDEDVLDAFYQFGLVFALALAEVGEYDRAIELMEFVRHSHDTWAERETMNQIVLAFMYLKADRPEDAAPLFQEAVNYLEFEYEDGIRHPGVLGRLALVYNMLGRDDEAMEMLRKSVDYHDRIPADAFRNEEDYYPAWQRFYDDPRFIAQMKRMQADLDQQAERVRAMLAQHDLDELLAPLMALAPEAEAEETTE